MQLNPSEISDLIRKRVEGFEARTEARNEGTVVSLADGVRVGMFLSEIGRMLGLD